jgi:hypothetical protein
MEGQSEMFWLLVGACIGILLGRWYEWMKWHYPESKEMIAVKLAQRRLERLRLEQACDDIKAEIDDDLDRRIGA